MVFSLQMLLILLLSYHMFGQYTSAVKQQQSILSVQQRLLSIQEEDARRDQRRWLDIPERMDRIENKLQDHIVKLSEPRK